MSAVTHCRDTLSGRPSALLITIPPTLGAKPPIAAKLRLRPAQSSMFNGDASPRDVVGVRSQARTICAGSGNGSGRSSVASTNAKMALLAPMPRAIVRMAVAAMSGFLRSIRPP